MTNKHESCPPIRQHITPYTHLKSFASSKDQVCVYRKDGRGWWSNIRKTACERYFYEFEIAGYRSNLHVEKKLGLLETEAAVIAPKLDKIQPLSDREFFYWSMYVATLYLRTRMYREATQAAAARKMTSDSSIREEQYKLFMNGTLVPFDDLKREAITRSEIFRSYPGFFHWLGLGIQLPILVQSLLSKEWIVMHTSGPETFITSDSPSYALNNPLKLTDPTGFEAACHWSGNDWDATPQNGGAKVGEC